MLCHCLMPRALRAQELFPGVLGPGARSSLAAALDAGDMEAFRAAALELPQGGGGSDLLWASAEASGEGGASYSFDGDGGGGGGDGGGGDSW